METLSQAIEPGALRVLAARRYFCAHGWNILCPCSECRAEFDAGMWDAPGSAVMDYADRMFVALPPRVQCTRCGEFGHERSPLGEPAGNNCRAAARRR